MAKNKLVFLKMKNVAHYFDGTVNVLSLPFLLLKYLTTDKN